MPPGAGGEVTGKRTATDVDIIVEANLPDNPWRIVDAKRQTMIVACLRVAVAGPCGTAVERGDKGRDLVRKRRLDANPGYRDRGCRAAGRKIAGLDGRPAERPVDEEIVGLAIEELDIRGMLASPDIQGTVEKALLEIGIVEPRVGQCLDLADGCEVVDVVT